MTAPWINQLYKDIKLLFDKREILNKGKLVSNNEEAVLYIENIKGIFKKYKLEFTDKKSYNTEHVSTQMDGLADINAMNQVKYNKPYKNYVIPYYPIINALWSWNDHFKMGIPSFLDDRYKLELLAKYIEVDDIKLGKKTLKNVEGYNLIPLFLSTKNLEMVTMNVYPEREIRETYNLYTTQCEYKNIYNMIDFFKKKIGEVRNYFYDNNTKEMCIVSFVNSEGLEKKGLFKKEIGEFNYGEYDEFYILSLIDKLEQERIPFKSWIFVGRENTLLIMDREINKEDKLWMKSNSSVVRYVSKACTEIVYVEERYRKQIEIENEIKRMI